MSPIYLQFMRSLVDACFADMVANPEAMQQFQSATHHLADAVLKQRLADEVRESNPVQAGRWARESSESLNKIWSIYR